MFARSRNRRRSRRSGWLFTGLRWLSRLLLFGVAASVMSVLLLRWLPPTTTGVMQQRQFQALLAGEVKPFATAYDWTPYADLSPLLALAVIAAEDQRFPDHYGFDFDAIEQALEDNADGKSLRGASTISQQVAKNLYLWSGRSWLRKGLEVWFTVLIEGLWPKQRILEVYLNIAEWGPRTFGAEAASRRYFRKPARQLTPQEAALLAAVLPNPIEYRVDKPSPYIRRRQDWILRQMYQLGGTGFLKQLE